MSLRDAAARAGSVEAVRLALEERQITARAAGFSNGRPASSIQAYWWERDAVRKIDPTNSQAVFEFAHTPDVTYEIVAFEIEILGAEALWPEVIVPAPPEQTVPTPRHAGGRPTEHKWEGAAQHVDRWVADRGPLQNKARAVELMIEWFGANDPPPPIKENIYRWIQEHPQRCQGWWD